MLKKIIFPLIISVLSCTMIYAYSVQRDLSNQIIRLHIIANSNSETDQSVKLKVRDAIIKNVGGDFIKIKNKNEYKDELIKKSAEIQKTAQKILDENNINYDADVFVDKQYIPRKTYDGLILPEGSYDAVVVNLGEGKGENWWCVVYPPLCFTESVCGELTDEAKKYLKETLSPESYSLITDKGISIEYKFKIVELFQKIQKKI